MNTRGVYFTAFYHETCHLVFTKQTVALLELNHSEMNMMNLSTLQNF